MKWHKRFPIFFFVVANFSCEVSICWEFCCSNFPHFSLKMNMKSKRCFIFETDDTLFRKNHQLLSSLPLLCFSTKSNNGKNSLNKAKNSFLINNRVSIQKIFLSGTNISFEIAYARNRRLEVNNSISKHVRKHNFAATYFPCYSHPKKNLLSWLIRSTCRHYDPSHLTNRSIWTAISWTAASPAVRRSYTLNYPPTMHCADGITDRI